MKVKALVLLFTGLLSACNVTGLENIRNNKLKDKKVIDYRNKISQQRSASIQSSETSFSNAIRCLSKPIINWRMFNITYEKQNGKTVLIQNLNDLNAKTHNLFDLSLSQNTSNKLINDKIEKLRTIVLPKYEQGKNKISLENELIKIKINSGKQLTSKEKEQYLHNQNKLNEYNNILNSSYNILNSSRLLQTEIDYVNNVNLANLLKISVAPIYDKTDKIFPNDSTALSELVSHSLSYNHAISLVDTPFNTDKAHISRVNLKGEQLGGSIGNSLPADMYITGAIVQYDEGDVKPFIEQAGLNLRAFQLNRNVQAITVGLVLRLVQSHDGILHHNKYMHRNNIDGYTYNINIDGDMHKPKPQSVFLQNTFFAERLNGGVTRIIGSKYWNTNINMAVEDPKMYAVREMVEKGVYELLDNAIPSYAFNNGQYASLHTLKHNCHNLLPVPVN